MKLKVSLCVPHALSFSIWMLGNIRALILFFLSALSSVSSATWVHVLWTCWAHRSQSQTPAKSGKFSSHACQGVCFAAVPLIPSWPCHVTWKHWGKIDFVFEFDIFLKVVGKEEKDYLVLNECLCCVGCSQSRTHTHTHTHTHKTKNNNNKP